MIEKKHRPCFNPPRLSNDHPWWNTEEEKEKQPTLSVCGEAHGFMELHGPELEPLKKREE